MNKAKIKKPVKINALGDLRRGRRRVYNDADLDALNYDLLQPVVHSYVTKIEPIQQMYDSRSKRMFCDNIDDRFDKDVLDVIGSMNKVGRAYVDPDEFTTRTRRIINKRENLCSLIAGGILGLASAALIYLKSKGYIDDNPMIYLSYAGTILTGLSLPALIIKTTGSSVMYNRLKDLIMAAEKTDEHLKLR